MLARVLAAGCLTLAACGRAESPLLPPVDPVFLHTPEFATAYKQLSPDEQKCFDPVSLVGLKPGRTWSFDWPEHPTGRVERATNRLGLSEDRETVLARSGARVLVAGDSHTEGVVWNAESFPHVVERRLHAAGRADVEVLNAGVGYLGPYGYLGVLRKYLALAPDVFVATVFCGNDFMDDLRVAYLRGLADEPAPGEAYYAPLREAESAWPAPCWQGVNQAYRFDRFPEEIGRALDAVEESFAGMQALCGDHGIALVAVLLPTKYDADTTEQRAELELLARHLGLDQQAMAVNARLGAELAARLERRGITCVDATEPFRAFAEPLYWRKDHHLNVRGHAQLASLLEATLEERLPPR